MAFPKVALVLGFLFVFGSTQAATTIRDHKSSVRDSSTVYSSTSDPVPSISYRRHSPDDSSPEYASTNDPVPSISYRKDIYSTSTPSDESSNNVSRNYTEKRGFTGAGRDLTYGDEIEWDGSTFSSRVSTTRSTGTPKGSDDPSTPYVRRMTTSHPSYTWRYSTGTGYHHTSSRDTGNPTVYTGRYTTDGRYTTGTENTAHPYTPSTRGTAGPAVYTGRYTTDERYTTGTESTGYPYTPSTRDTAGPTVYTGRYTTPGGYKTSTEDTAYPYTPSTRNTDDPYTPSTRNTADPYTPSTRNTADPYTPSTRNTADPYTPTPDTAYPPTSSTWDPTGNCVVLDTRPPSSIWKRITTPGRWETTPRRPTPSWWWITMPKPTGKPTTKSKNSGSDLVPGSLKNYFFIACEKCNVFSKIKVQKDAQKALNSNNDVIFQNVIDDVQTKIDVALQNVMTSLKEMDRLRSEE